MMSLLQSEDQRLVVQIKVQSEDQECVFSLYCLCVMIKSC
jgi:hypothetical protein